MAKTNKNSISFLSRNAKGLCKIFLGLWIIIIFYGIISLILSIVNLTSSFIWLIFFSNILSLIPYALMFFPTLQIFIILSDIIKEKKFEGDSKIVKAFLTQFIIALLTSLLVILIFGGMNLTSNIVVEFFTLFSLWIFFISLIVFLIYVFYSYFGEV
jgi:hypothetical protein